MTRKSKQPGGHNPLTYRELKRLKSSGYGTQSTRLSTASQLPFGHCCLNLSPIDTGDTSNAAVATPSGHIYSREAIVQYLITKNGELKKQKVEYERQRLEVENRRVEWEEKERKRRQDVFVRKDQGAMMVSNAAATTTLVLREEGAVGAVAGRSAAASAATSATTKEKPQNSLKHVSYWLATSQPQQTKSKNDGSDFDYEKEIAALPPTPPERPPSPFSGTPLKLKQLIPLHLVHEGAEDGANANSSKSKATRTGRILCAVSHKTITTQPTIAIRTSGQIMLKSVYDELAKPTMTCPVTGKKFKEKDVLELIKGKSGYAASGTVVATKYNPTLT